MITYIKNYFKEIKLINEYYKHYKNTIDEYPTYEKDFYIHITPYDLGQETILKALICPTGTINFKDPDKSCFLEIPQLCVSKTVIECVVSIFYEKFNLETMYVYRTIKKEYAYSHMFNPAEYKIFKDTQFIKIGTIKNCKLIYEILKELDIKRIDNLKNEDEILKDKVFTNLANEYAYKLQKTFLLKCK